MNKIDFIGIRIGALTLDDIADKVIEFADGPGCKFMTYFNAHCLNVSFDDREYKEILKAADLVYAGGQGIVWASRLLGSPLPERVNILDFFDRLSKQLADKKIRIYLLGGERGVARDAGERLKKIGLCIVGTRDGFFTREEEKGVIMEINNLRPQILIVGMGVPKQEKWISGHLNELDANLCWSVGAAFEWLSGYRKRAPKWMIKSGLEWLHRLYQQPIRLCRRYFLGNLVFIYHILRARFPVRQAIRR